MSLAVALVVLLHCYHIAASTNTNNPTIQDITTLQRRMALLEESMKEHAKYADYITNLEAKLHNTTVTISGMEVTISGLEADLEKKENEHSVCLDFVWLLICGALVMFMQAGFAILESGSCRAKNAATVLMKNLMDTCVGAFTWYLLGYGLAYGAYDKGVHRFSGSARFAGSAHSGEDYLTWFFQWAFCATAATIVSGGVAERMKFRGYVVYSIVMTAIIYPIIVYWTWSSEGFLVTMGYSDFAGSGIVHLTGGIGALVGAAICGPRTGRWERRGEDFDPHNMGLVVLGTFILWFGWYGFNCGSTLSLKTADDAHTAARVATNTSLAAAAGGLSVFLLRLRHKRLDMAGTCNGILAGLVAVCAGVANIDPGVAILTGLLGGIAAEIGSVGVQKLKIDDPLDAFAVHGCGGLIGMLTRPLFDYAGPNVDMFLVHLLGIVCIVGWSGGLSVITFGLLRYFDLLVKSKEAQEIGADCHMASAAYHVTEDDRKGTVTETNVEIPPQAQAVIGPQNTQQEEQI